MIVKSIKHARSVFERICTQPDWSIDTETEPAPGYEGDKENALVFGRMRIKIWSLCRRGESYSFPTNLFNPLFPTMAQYADALRPYLEDAKVVKVMHNANYDVNVFWATTSNKVVRNFWDTMIGAWMANVAIEKGLKNRAPLYGRVLGSLHVSKEMQKKGFSAVSMSMLDQVAEYAEEDVITTDELYQMQTVGYVMRPKVIRYLDAKGKLVEVDNPMPAGKFVAQGEGPLTKFRRVWIQCHELPYLKATMRAERLGFPYSRKKAEANRKQCAEDKDKILRKLYKSSGCTFNLNSTAQIMEHLFKPNGIEPPFKTKTGKPKMDAQSLFLMRDMHPLVGELERYRKLNKLQEVYLGDPEKGTTGLEFYLAPDGRIHCTMNTLGAVTGRTSAQLPNLTNTPQRADIYNIKASFVPPKGQVIICGDYAQLEIRIMAIMSKDPAMIKILCDPKGDIHQNTADEFGVDRSPTAKQLNFLMLYGGGNYMLSMKLTSEGVPTGKREAQSYIDRYNQVYYRVHEFREELLDHHRNKGYIKLLTGRRRWLDDIDWDNEYSVHKAETTLSNNVIQGSGQDMLKASIIRCDPTLPNYDAILPEKLDMPKSHRLLLKDYSKKVEKVRALIRQTHTRWALQVHDEVVYFSDESAASEVMAAICDVMTWHHFFPATTSYSVPLVVEAGTGYSWQHAKSKKPIEHCTAGF